MPGRSDFPMDSHLLRAEYTGLALGKLEAYTYLLAFDDRVSERFSTATGGLRLEGDQGLIPNATLTYAGEFAHQRDYAENSNDIDVNYYLGEVGVSYNLGWQLQTVALNVGYEVLEGDGGVDAFQTPLGTNHAFQGWADRFLTTPGDGVEDLYVTLKLSAFGAVLLAVYHDFNADDCAAALSMRNGPSKSPLRLRSRGEYCLRQPAFVLRPPRRALRAAPWLPQ